MAEKKTKTEFGDPAKVINVVKAMQDIERLRANDRAKIDSLFNGQRPYTPEEVEKFNIQVNVNWGEGKRIMRDANSQLNNALIHPGPLLQCSLRKGPVDKRDEWSAIFSKNLHIPLQEGISGRKNFFLIKDRNASVCMHGIGALMWSNPFIWRPRFVALEDLLIPTETKCDFSNLRYFAVNLYLTIGELIEMTQGDKVRKGWNMEMVNEILKGTEGIYNESTPSTARDQPEAQEQIYYQNKGYYYSDSIPKIRCVQFFWQEPDVPNKWYRVVYLRENPGNKVKDIDKKFLFDGTGEPFADDISQILNVQYGDSNFVAPLKYHNVRGLGIDLYSPIETLNRLRCEYVQAVFEHMKMYFRIKDPADRDRAKQQILQQYGFIMDGMEIVPQQQRHQIDPTLINNAMGQMNEILQESSSSFIAGQDRGTERQMTAKEAMIRVNQANVLVGAMLATMYLQEGFYYNEIKRRFCQKDPTDPDIKAFQDRCKREGIPLGLIQDADSWKVIPERVLGGGDKSLAQQQAAWLLSVKTMFDPKAQQTILRLATQSMLDDPAKAAMLVPQTPPQTTAGSEMAEQLFGTLMNGIQCAPRTGFDIQGYVIQMLKMMGAVVQRISQTDGMGTIEEVAGLQAVAQNVAQYLQVLSGDDTQKQLVKQAGDALGKIMNEVKAFGQRLQEKHTAETARENISINYKDAPEDIKRQMEAAAGMQPSQLPPGANDPKTAKAIQTMQLNAASHQQRSVLEQQRFEHEQARLNAQTQSEIHRQNMAMRHKLLNENIKSTADAVAKLNKPEKSD